MRVPKTQMETLRRADEATKRGLLFCPTGEHYKRAHALARNGLLEPIHGRKGEGVEQYRPSAGGRELLASIAYRKSLHY